MLEHIITCAVRETIEKNSLISIGMYDAVPVPVINTLDLYTCDATYVSGKYIIFSGNIVVTSLSRAFQHWGEDVTVFRIKLPADTEILWYDKSFGEIAKFAGPETGRIILEDNEVTTYEV